MEPQELADNNERANIHFSRVPEDKERMGMKNYLKKGITKTFPHLAKYINLQIQETE